MTSKIKKQFDEFHAHNLMEWRKWLANNHNVSEGLRLILAKKDSGLSSANLDDAIEEALCFGWIDSLPNQLDDKRFKTVIGGLTRHWSRVNKERIGAAASIKSDTATRAKNDRSGEKIGYLAAMDEIENLVIPPDLGSALDKHIPAKANFEAFLRSVKRGILEWILNAKKPETRKKRLLETATQAAQNIRANQFRPIKSKS